MKPIINYIRTYLLSVDRKVLTATTLAAALFIFLNYYFRIDDRIDWQHNRFTIFVLRYLVFFLAFGLPWFFYLVFSKRKYFRKRNILFVILLAPAVFSLKMAMHLYFRISGDESWDFYWNIILYWPARLLIMVAILFIFWKLMDRDQPFYGTAFKHLKWKPYLLMLAFMVPLIAMASTQPDFLVTYPKLKMIGYMNYDSAFTGWHELIFELSYGSDFIGIELFFRGFLVLACIKWAGKDVILPMALFYCTIHFGKPLGECISSYFGGIILGIVSYHTRSIWGGLAVHLGIAWLMELGGYIGNAV